MMELPITVKPNLGVSILRAMLNRFTVIILPMSLFIIALITSGDFQGIVIPLIGIIGAFTFIFIILVILTTLNVKATEYKITHEGVYFKEGFFTRREKFLPLKKATDVRLVQRWPLDIWYHTGSVVIETAGRGSALALRTVSNPKKYYEALKELILK